MAGIINYFHGETGTVNEFFWRLTPSDIRLVIAVDEDPHRVRAFDYGGDVSFDPAILPKDHVTYLRLDQTCGMWVRTVDIERGVLHRSLRRVRKNRLMFDSMSQRRKRLSNNKGRIADELTKETSICSRISNDDDIDWINNVPATGVSLFLSYSNRDVLLTSSLGI